GSYLGPGNTARYQREAIDGLKNVMAALGMLSGPAPKPPRQIHFDTRARREIRPSQSGYLESYYEHADDLGKEVAAGTRLGQVIELHRLRVHETLTAPVDGYLFCSRYSGVVRSGTQAFAIAQTALSTWLD